MIFNQIILSCASLQAWISKGSQTQSFLNAPKLAWQSLVKAPLSEPQLQEVSNKSVSSISLYNTTVNCCIKNSYWLEVSFIRSLELGIQVRPWQPKIMALFAHACAHTHMHPFVKGYLKAQIKHSKLLLQNKLGYHYFPSLYCITNLSIARCNHWKALLTLPL